MLKLNAQLAQAADNIVSAVTETGKYIGTITRAEKLKASTGTLGLGLSFKADTGQTVDYLDLYHTKGDGGELPGLKTVNAILCCTKTAEAAEGPIKVERWNAEQRVREQVSANGYPALMNKRIGLLLQKTIETDQKGQERARMQVFGVFNAETELTASEMYAKKANPERLAAMLEALMARPVRDNRKAGTARPASGGGVSGAGADRFEGMPDDDQCPF